MRYAETGRETGHYHASRRMPNYSNQPTTHSSSVKHILAVRPSFKKHRTHE